MVLAWIMGALSPLTVVASNVPFTFNQVLSANAEDSELSTGIPIANASAYTTCYHESAEHELSLR